MTQRNYNDPLYKKFRADVRRRDQFTCQWPNCGYRKRLRVHHIRTWSEYPALRFEISNGICLCKTHHDQIWGMEDVYAPVFFKLLRLKEQSRDDKRSKKPRKITPVEQSRPIKNPTSKIRRNAKARFNKRYAQAKRKARRRK